MQLYPSEPIHKCHFNMKYPVHSIVWLLKFDSILLTYTQSRVQTRVTKAELLQEGIFFLIHLFARDVLLMKKLEIKKTKPTFIISVLKVEYQMVLVSLISNFFDNKTSLVNKWMSLALIRKSFFVKNSQFIKDRESLHVLLNEVCQNLRLQGIQNLEV